VRLSFGIGIIFVPFALVLSAEYGVAASYASQLSDVAVGLVMPFGMSLPLGGATLDADNIPTPAVVVLEETDVDAHLELGALWQSGKAATKSRDRGKSKPPTAHELPAILVRADTVLRLANGSRRPTGKSVTADGRRPAGVQVFGASSLGVGVRDGDVITRVSGVPVTSPSQIIALVIAARGARQLAVSAQLYRGQRSYTLTVEQPYLKGGDPPVPEDPPAGAQ